MVYVRNVHPPRPTRARIRLDTYLYLKKKKKGFRVGNGLPFFCRVPDPPDSFIKIKNPNLTCFPYPSYFFLSLIFYRLTLSRVTAKLPGRLGIYLQSRSFPILGSIIHIGELTLVN